VKPDFSYKILQKTEQYIFDNEMIRHDDSVVLGLSGGADSICLFLLLNRLKDKYGLDIHALHINHGIRGESADRDEQFCKDLCMNYEIPFTAYHINVPAMAKEEGKTLEEAGRNARYNCFVEYAADLSRAQGKNVCIAVAHHMNDQAETVIFNMLRGSGLKGIGGMSPVSERNSSYLVNEPQKTVTVIRPLMCLTKEEIENYLEFAGQDYCEDETNSDNEYSRNLIRNEVIPKLSEIQPRLTEHICMMSDEAREAQEYIDQAVTKCFEKCAVKEVNGFRLSVSSLKEEEPLIVRHVIILTLRHMIEAYKDITRTHIEDVYELFYKGKGKYVMLPYGITAKREKDSVVITQE